MKLRGVIGDEVEQVEGRVDSILKNNTVFVDKTKPGHSPRQNGFTLVEVLAVLVIVSVLAAFAVSRINFDTNLRAEVDKMKSQLRYVQQIALCGNNTYTWRITVNANSYTFTRCDVNGVNCVTMPLPGATGGAPNTVNLPASITVTAGIGAINFDQWGSPGNNSINIRLTDGGTSRGITVTKNTGFIP